MMSQENFVNFTFDSLFEVQLASGKIDKQMEGMPSWKKINKENYKKYIKSEHTGHAIITGEKSNITVFDFDDVDVYNYYVEQIPELRKYRTIRTKKGYHIYCSYDKDIITTTNAFINHTHVDIRNDGGMVFAAPCQRVLLDGSIFTYTDLGGEILPVPQLFKDNLKQYQKVTAGEKKIESPVLSNETPVSSEKQDEKNYKDINNYIEQGWLNDMAAPNNSNEQSYDLWRNVGFAIKHTLPNSKGLELFQKFSQINAEKYDEKYTTEFWNTIKQTGKALTLGSIKYWVRKYKETHSNKKTSIFTDVFAENDDQAGNIIISMLKDKLTYHEGQLFYKKGWIWIYDSEKIEACLMDYILSCGLRYPPSLNEDTGEMKPGKKYCSNISQAKNVYKALLIKLKSKDNINIYEKFHNTTKNRLCFLDGVLDFEKKKFFLWDEVKFELYTTTLIERNFYQYFMNPDEKIINKIKTDIFQNLFGNDEETAYHFLSRGITANIKDKNWASYLGNRNCGKGVLYDLLKCAFEKYVTTFELSNILSQGKTDISEVSRKMYWSIDLQFSRIAISQETPKSGSGSLLSGKMMKKLAGGGDEIVARRNYDRVDLHFKIDTTFLIMGNDYLEVDVKDTNDQRIEFNSTVSFKSKEELHKMKEDGVEDIIINAYKVRDDKIKDDCNKEEYANAMVMLLYQKWKDKAVYIKKEIDEESTCLRKQILDLYQITGKVKEDYVLIKSCEADLEENSKKISNEMKSLGINKVKLTSGIDKSKYAYVGIVRKVVQEPPKEILF